MKELQRFRLSLRWHLEVVESGLMTFNSGIFKKVSALYANLFSAHVKQKKYIIHTIFSVRNKKP